VLLCQSITPIALAATLLAGAFMAQPPHVNFTRYPSGNTFLDLTAGPDGSLWFLESGAIARMTTAGVITEFATPNHGGSITVGPDGALWFTQWGNPKIYRITTDGALTEHSLPCCGGAAAITTGPDHALWFTESQSNRVGRITPDGAVTEYSLPNPDVRAYAIKPGPDGSLWFAESIPHNPGANGLPFINAIGRMSTTGQVTEYALPPSTVFQGIGSLAAGSDGAMWFTEYYKSCIGRISMTGEVTEYGTTGPGFPTAITAGPDGALWFLESSDVDWIRTIGRMTTAGEFTQFEAPVQNINGGAITLGPDGALWFTNAWSLDATIVRVALEPARSTAPRQRRR